MIWRSSLQMAHYRSNAAYASTIVTRPLTVEKTVSVIEALYNGASAFWNASGGAQMLDAASLVPAFSSDIVLRGGKTSLSFFNDSTVNPVEIEAFYVAPIARVTTSSIPTSVSVGWDPSIIPEFNTTVGRIIYRTKFLLEPLATSTIDRRLRVQKIDQAAFTSGQRPRWIVTARDFAGSAVLTTNVICCVSFNLSFAGDVF